VFPPFVLNVCVKVVVDVLLPRVGVGGVTVPYVPVVVVVFQCA
jgi:hypothetical protein